MHLQTQGWTLVLKFGLVDSSSDFELNHFTYKVNFLHVASWNYNIIRTFTNSHPLSLEFLTSCIKTDTSFFFNTISVEMLPRKTKNSCTSEEPCRAQVPEIEWNSIHREVPFPSETYVTIGQLWKTLMNNLQ